MRSSIVEVKMGHWMGDQNLLSHIPTCFARHVKSLDPAAFAVNSTYQSALGLRCGYWPVLLMGNPLGMSLPQQ
jgi:hypothetical protein